MENEVSGMWITGLIFIAIGVGMMMCWSYSEAERDMRIEAKKRGFMEFKLNESDGKAKLEWK